MVGVGEESRLPDRNSLKKMKYLVLKEGITMLTGPSLSFEEALV
jgi:hypothetical protein